MINDQFSSEACQKGLKLLNCFSFGLLHGSESVVCLKCGWKAERSGFEDTPKKLQQYVQRTRTADGKGYEAGENELWGQIKNRHTADVPVLRAVVKKLYPAAPGCLDEVAKKIKAEVRSIAAEAARVKKKGSRGRKRQREEVGDVPEEPRRKSQRKRKTPIRFSV